MTGNDLHEQARAYAAAGMRVFPCWPGTKIPATDNGFHDASDDPNQIDAWWSYEPRYNIGCSPGHMGWSVVDLDKAKKETEIDGIDGWGQLLQQHGSVPDTYTVRTPGTGSHLWFDGQLKTTARGLFEGMAIDTRGEGGYVLLPPSVVEGRPYVVARDCDIAPLPAFVSMAAAHADRAVEGNSAQPDTERALARADAYLRDCRRGGSVGVEGSRNAECYARACDLRDLGLSRAATEALLLADWFPHIDQPSGHAFTSDELAGRVASAFRNAQNGDNAWSVGSPAETFAHAVEALSKPQSKPSRFALTPERDMDIEPAPSWLVQGLIPSAGTIVMVGRTGSYKSFLALDLALSIATGTRYADLETQSGPVVYAALEGGVDIRTKRRRAWRALHEIQGSIGNFYFSRAPFVIDPEQVQQFGDEVKKLPKAPKLIVVDTLAKSAAGLNLNNPGDCTRFSNWADSMVEAFGCSVLVIGHEGKDETRGLAGSIQLKSNFDTELTVKASKGHHKAVELWVTKQKDADEPEAPITFELQKVGASLVPVRTTQERHAELTRKAEAVSAAAVAKVLTDLGSVSTSVLAGALVPALPNEDVDKRLASIVEMERMLVRESTKRLAGFAYGKKSGLRWEIAGAPGG